MSLGIYGGGVPFAQYQSGRIPAGLSYQSTASGVEFFGVATQPGRYVSYWLGPFPDPAVYRPYTYTCISDSEYLGALGFRCNYTGCHEGVGHVVVTGPNGVIYDGHPTTSHIIPIFGSRSEEGNTFSASVVYDGGGHCCDRAEFTTWKINYGWGFLANSSVPEDPWNTGVDTIDSWNNAGTPHDGPLYYPWTSSNIVSARGNATVIGTHNLDNLSTCEHVDGGVATWSFDVPSLGQLPSGNLPCPVFPCPLFRHIISGAIIQFCPPTRFAIIIVIPPVGGGNPGIQDTLPDPSLIDFSSTHNLSLSPVTWGKSFRALREVPIANARRSPWAAARKLSIDFQQVGTGAGMAHFEPPVTPNSNAGILISSEGPTDGGEESLSKHILKANEISATDYTASDWNVVGATPSSQQTPEYTLLSAGQRIFGSGLSSVPIIDGSTRQSAINYTLRINSSPLYRFYSTVFYSIPLQAADLRIIAIEDRLSSSDLPARIRLRRYTDHNPSDAVAQINRFEEDWSILYGLTAEGQPATEGYGALLPYKRVVGTAEDRTYFMGLLIPPRASPTTITLSATLKVTPL